MPAGHSFLTFLAFILLLCVLGRLGDMMGRGICIEFFGSQSPGSLSGLQGVCGLPLGRTLPPSASGGNFRITWVRCLSHFLVEKLFPYTILWFSVR